MLRNLVIKSDGSKNMSSTIVVTGAARGIGAAITKQLLQQGYQVIGIDRLENPEQWEISKNLTSDECLHWQGISQDITQQQATQKLIADLLEEHNITGLVNAAGVLIMRSMLEAKIEDWETLFAVNVMAPIAISQQLAKHFCEKKQGSIVTISSNSSRMPRIQLGMYATSKAALSHYCRNLALEIAPHQVRLNIVSPGSTLTQMQQQLWTDNTPPPAVIDGDLSQYRTGIPLRKLAQPEDIANTVSFLLSDQAAQITMQEIVVDGGATLGV